MTQIEQRQTEQLPASPGSRERIVPKQSVGMPPTAQTFFAVVDASGTLVRKFHATSSRRLGTGQYEVIFAHDVTGSAYVASIADTLTGIPLAGEIGVAPRSGAADGVFVGTWDSTGNFADRAFHLAVHS
jgi:hypothetical protein